MVSSMTETNANRTTLALALTGSLAASLAFALACPPFGYSTAAWLVPGILLVTARRLSIRKAFEAGLLFGLVSTALVGRWLPQTLTSGLDLSPLQASLLVYATMLVTVGIPAGVMCAGYAWASRRVEPRDLPIIGATFWLCAEWIACWGWGGPTLGHTQFRELWLIQVADLGGAFAVSFVVALVSISVAEVCSRLLSREIGFGAALRALRLSVATLAVAFFYGVSAQSAHGLGATTPLAVAERAVVPAAFSTIERPQLQLRQVSTIDATGMRVSPLLCKDVRDRELVHDLARQGADVLINHCRDRELGEPGGAADQLHLATAVLLIVTTGETRRQPPKHYAPGAMSAPTTHYTRWGDYWILSGLGLCLIVIGRGRG